MDCRRAEELVNSYIDRSISMRDMEAFLEHVETCSSCYDELETYFIVHEAMAQLNDEENDTILDIKNMLREDIWNSRIYLRKIRFLKMVGIAAGIFVLGSVVLALVYAMLMVFQIV